MTNKNNTKNSANGHRRRDLEAKQLARAVVTKLAEKTGSKVEEGWALRTAETILAGAPQPPDDPTAYVVAAIDRDPDPATRFLPINRPGYS